MTDVATPDPRNWKVGDRVASVADVASLPVGATFETPESRLVYTRTGAGVQTALGLNSDLDGFQFVAQLNIVVRSLPVPVGGVLPSNPAQDAQAKALALADHWDGGADKGRAHIMECSLTTCARCVLAEAAIDLREAFTDPVLPSNPEAAPTDPCTTECHEADECPRGWRHLPLSSPLVLPSNDNRPPEFIGGDTSPSHTHGYQLSGVCVCGARLEAVTTELAASKDESERRLDALIDVRKKRDAVVAESQRMAMILSRIDEYVDFNIHNKMHKVLLKAILEGKKVM